MASYTHSASVFVEKVNIKPTAKHDLPLKVYNDFSKAGVFSECKAEL